MLCSPVMRRLDRTLRAVAPKDVGISLVGESGTGKEVLARLIHELSPRRSKPFVPINCAAVPEALFESELFGHEKGSFTGATERMKGKIEPANGGTLFLDEIADMPFAMQGKLLRFLENQKFMRVGGAEKISVSSPTVSPAMWNVLLTKPASIVSNGTTNDTAPGPCCVTVMGSGASVGLLRYNSPDIRSFCPTPVIAMSAVWILGSVLG